MPTHILEQIFSKVGLNTVVVNDQLVFKKQESVWTARIKKTGIVEIANGKNIWEFNNLDDFKNWLINNQGV